MDFIYTLIKSLGYLALIALILPVIMYIYGSFKKDDDTKFKAEQIMSGIAITGVLLIFVLYMGYLYFSNAGNEEMSIDALATSIGTLFTLLAFVSVLSQYRKERNERKNLQDIHINQEQELKETIADLKTQIEVLTNKITEFKDTDNCSKRHEVNINVKEHKTLLNILDKYINENRKE